MLTRGIQTVMAFLDMSTLLRGDGALIFIEGGKQSFYLINQIGSSINKTCLVM